MKPKISIVTLAVADMARAVRFYREGLGFPMHNYTDGDDFAMFKLEGSWLAVHPRTVEGSGSPGASISHNEPSQAGVDAVFAAAIAAGAIPLVAPRQAHWGGYEANFADADGHVWDIAYNPYTDLT